MNRFARFVLAYEPIFAVPLAVLLIVSTSISWFGLLALLPWLVRWRVKGYATARTPFDLALVIFFLGLIVGFYPSVDLRVSVEAFRSYLGSVLLYYTIVNNVTAQKLKYWLLAIALTLFLGTLFALTTPTKVTILNSWAFELAKALPKIDYLGYFPHMNNLAGVLIVFVAVMGGVVFFSKERSQRFLALGLGGFFGLAVVLTSSRAALIGLGFALMLLAIHRNRWFLLVLVGFVALLGFALSSGFIAPKELLEIGSGNTLISRAQLWTSTLDMLGDMPITGIGLGSFPLVYRLYVSPAQPYVLTHPHNSLLQLYCDTGLIGLAALAVALFSMARMALRVMKTQIGGKWYGYVVGTFAGFVALVLHSLFESSTVAVAADAVGNYHYTVIPVVFVLIGLMVATAKLGEIPVIAGASQNGVVTGSDKRPMLVFEGTTAKRVSPISPLFLIAIVAVLAMGYAPMMLGVFYRNFGNVELTKALLEDVQEERVQAVENRFVLSLRFLEGAAWWNPADLRVLRSLGRISFELRDYNLAAEYLVEYLAKVPNDAIARTQLGFAYAASGQEERANQEWLLGGTAGFFYEEARKSLEGQDFVRALQLADRAVKLSPSLPGPSYVRGRALTFMGRLPEAAVSLRYAVELYDFLGEAGPDAMMARGHYYSLAGGWNKAVAAFEGVTLHKNSTDGQKFEAYEGLGKSLYRGLGRPEEAIQSYQKAAELAPGNMWELLNIGDILTDQGEVNEARKWYSRAAQMNPNSDEVSHRVALSYVKEGRILMTLEKWDEAIEAFVSGLEIEPELAVAQFGIGEVQVLGSHDLQGAEDHFLLAAQLAGEDSDLLIRSYTYLSSIAQMSNRPQAAAEWQSRADDVRRH